MQFEITPDEHARIEKWLNEVIYPPIIERQLNDPKMREMLEIFGCKGEDGKFKRPYGGAIGGGLTYEFSPTSIGTCLTVRWHTGESLDLTDYDTW